MRRLWRKSYVQKEWWESNRDNLCFWVHKYVLISQVSPFTLRFYYCIIAEGKAGLWNYTSTQRKAARVVYKHSLPLMYYWSVTEGEVHIEGRTELDSRTLYKKTCCSVISVVVLVTASKSMAETRVPLIKFSHLSYGRSYAQRLTLIWWNNGTLIQSNTTHSPTQWSWFCSWWRPLWSKCSTINPLLSLLPRTAWSISETTFLLW